MKTKAVFFTVFISILLAALTVRADEKVVYTTDGEKFTGTIISQDGNFITLRLGGGTARIPKSIITKTVDYVEEVKPQLIVIYDEKLAKRTHEELRNGADFTRLVEWYSMDLTFFTEGKTDFVDRSYFPKNVSDIVFITHKDRFTNPLKAGGAFYIVKVLEKRKVERDPAAVKEKKTPKGEGTEAEKAPPVEIQAKPVRIAVLPILEKTREAEVGSLGADTQELLVSEILQATGLEAFSTSKVPKPEEENPPKFLVTGEVARFGPAYAIQVLLKDSKDRELFTSDRLTAVCIDDNIEDFIKAVKQLAEALVREIQRPR